MSRNNATDDRIESRRSVLKKSGRTLGAIGLGSMALTGSAEAATATTRHQTVDLEGFRAWNPCTNEDVVTTQGTQKFVFHTTRDEDGGVHSHVKVTIQHGKGVGAETGIRYQLNESASLNLTVKPPFPKTRTFVATAAAVSQGTAPDLRLKERIHMTINANGAFVNSVEFAEIECTG